MQKKTGVMFTANPINNNTDEMMINASWGLGEAVVSGSVTPDEYIINKKTKEVIEKNIASKITMVVKKKETVGTEYVDVKNYLGSEYVEKECLTEKELNKLIEMGLKIEKFMAKFKIQNGLLTAILMNFIFYNQDLLQLFKIKKKKIMKA